LHHSKNFATREHRGALTQRTSTAYGEAALPNEGAQMIFTGETTMDTSEVVELGSVMELTKGEPPGTPVDNVSGGTPNYRIAE
jgi:hypothetical protein